jgi:MoxR-like ATPase
VAIDFHIFTGNEGPHVRIKDLPDPPPWRRFVREGEEHKDKLDPTHILKTTPTKRDLALATRYKIAKGSPIVDAVNAALHLRRPLLITGPAGSGKSSLIYAVAHELQLGPVLTWNITSRSTLREGLYEYDALARLQSIQAGNKSARAADFLTLGPLGTALLPANWPKALLIDEIDKADLDLPNDLLNLIEEGKYTIEELSRDPASTGAEVKTYKSAYGMTPVEKDGVQCTVFPFVVMTSNREREFSAPFLRRCIRVELDAPDTKEALRDIVEKHLGPDLQVNALDEAAEFLKRDKPLSTDQLMNAMYVLEHSGFAGNKEQLLYLLYAKLT